MTILTTIHNKENAELIRGHAGSLCTNKLRGLNVPAPLNLLPQTPFMLLMTLILQLHGTLKTLLELLNGP